MSHIPSNAIPHAKPAEPAPAPARRVAPAAIAAGVAIAGGLALAAATLLRGKPPAKKTSKRKRRATAK